MSPTPLTRVLVANRGEIAARVFATCRTLGIGTVAVHSDADAGLPYVAEADLAVRLPGETPAETYLRGDLLVEAARRAGADAVHPGYGFLSESPAFARAVVEAGLVWIGPSPASMDAMASKIEAKQRMRAAGVPVLEAPEDPGEADLPLLVKASAGGGGRGMRVVRELAALAEEIDTAAAEAAAAFGDGTVFVEPYVEAGRHVEVQVLGRGDGTVAVLGSRDCSAQRRHQKVVEEAPPPGMGPAQLTALHDAARRAGEAIGYLGAGTVEFLVDAADPDRFWFLEMNTRLQVEHPVTECVTGLDLVALQLAVAAGEPVSLEAGVPTPDGHAIEARLYAEDPRADYRPQSGPLEAFDLPGVRARMGPLPGPGIRLDAGYAAGDVVSTHYDPMLAKVIAWAPTRAEAAARLAACLERATLAGPGTNRDQLVALLRSEDFRAGRVSTALLADPSGPGADPGPDRDTREAAGLVAAAVIAEEAAGRRRVQAGVPVAWRNVPSQPQRSPFEDLDVDWYPERDGGYRHATRDLVARVGGRDGDVVRVALVEAGVVRRVEAVLGRGGDVVTVAVPTATGVRSVQLRARPRFTDPADRVAEGSLLAPMPGTVVSVAVAQGERVRAGQRVLVLEAMKMQHTVTAPADGTVAEIHVATGGQVAAGVVLAVVEPDVPTEEESA